MNAYEAELQRAFVAEGNAAMLSLDEAKIRAFVRKWHGHEWPPEPDIFWGAVHKAITGRASLPIEFRRKSKAYLDERGLRSFDDGDL